MSFAGLIGRLREKKAGVTAATSESNATVASTDAIYENAVQEACKNHSERKRQRSPAEVQRCFSSAPGSAVSEVDPDATSVQHSGFEKRSPLLNEEEFTKRLKDSKEVVTQCVKQIAGVMSVPFSIDPAASISWHNEMDSGVPFAYYASGLPLPLCNFLSLRLSRTCAATTALSVLQDDSEFELLCSLRDSFGNLFSERIAIPEPLRHVTILQTFWFLLCLHWKAALCGTVPGGSPRDGGWTFDAYLLQQHALPDVVRHTRGRQIAQTLEVWQTAFRVRQDTFDFLAIALHDLCVMSQQLTKGDKTPSMGTAAIPTDMVKMFFNMVECLRRRDFLACRQLYVDLTMGTANWKLGLFSGGEVHMRRSMERIERRRIAHLLHNENALRLLHALRELMDFAQLHGSDSEFSAFFVAS
ncbi:hypothetical protein TRVL_05105 [Trypanosoma vivax]|nr:hypothetical protein TRVL_05105 [Trypanosoma vivax]